MTTDTIVSKVWSFCTTLRDDGVGYGDYLEQLTYLIFLKMADEYGRAPYNRNVGVPAKYNWATLKKLKGAELEGHYIETLRELGTEKGMLGQIFTKAQNKIQDPAKLARLSDMVDSTSWVSLEADTKGDIYEGILEKNAEDTKSGAGQYFTPRALIAAMVECVAPEPGKTIADPACGTGGFFLAAYDYLTRDGNKLNKDEKTFLKKDTFSGNEIVAGIGPTSTTLSSAIHFGWRTSASSSTATTPPTATSGSPRGMPRRTPEAAGGSTPTRNSRPVTKPASTSSGSRTTASRISTTSPSPPISPKKSSRTSRQDLRASARSQAVCRRQDEEPGPQSLRWQRVCGGASALTQRGGIKPSIRGWQPPPQSPRIPPPLSGRGGRQLFRLPACDGLSALGGILPDG